VESSGNQNITLLAIEPDVEKQQVKISGEAKSFNVLMNYMTHLQGQAVFARCTCKIMMSSRKIRTNPYDFRLLQHGRTNHDARIE